jgi:cytochrome c nitrite reductase small subunit
VHHRSRVRLTTSLPFAVIALAVSVGILGGTGLYTFSYAKGISYLSNDPAACANCHVMQVEYAAWSRSSHHAVAVCNDCHTPPGLVGKLWTKALNGYHHSRAFTLGAFPDAIQITERNRAIAQQACTKCHAELVHAIDRAGTLDCLHCHADVGHLR